MMNKEALTKLINDVLAYPLDYPELDVHRLISALEKLEEES